MIALAAALAALIGIPGGVCLPLDAGVVLRAPACCGGGCPHAGTPDAAARCCPAPTNAEGQWLQSSGVPAPGGLEAAGALVQAAGLPPSGEAPLGTRTARRGRTGPVFLLTRQLRI